MVWTRVKTATKDITIEKLYPEVTDFKIVGTDKDSYVPGETMNITLSVTVSKATEWLLMHFVIYLDDVELGTSDDVSQFQGSTAQYNVPVTLPSDISPGTHTLKAECWALYP